MRASNRSSVATWLAALVFPALLLGACEEDRGKRDGKPTRLEESATDTASPVQHAKAPPQPGAPAPALPAPGAPPTPSTPSTPPQSGAPSSAPPSAPPSIPPPTASGPSQTGPIDAKQLLASIRESARPDLATAAGVTSLDELPMYDLDLKLDASGESFELAEEVWFTNRESGALDEVVLRVYANSSDGGASTAAGPLVKLDRGECVAQTCAVATAGASTISVKPASALAPGARLQIKLRLSGRLTVIDSSRTNMFAQGLESLTMLGGGEPESFGILAKGDNISSLANFYAVVGRRRNGAWEREDKSTMGDLGSDDMAHVRARVDVPEAMKVTTTGVTTATYSPSAGRRIHEVSAAMVRDFAVVASPDFETAEAKVGDVVVRSHFLGKERRAGERALDTAKEALTIFERRFGPYPYADLDIVEAALIGGAGGVEFAGLVTIASMMYRPAFPTDGPLGGLFELLGKGGGPGSPMTDITDRMLEFTTAHEVGHQYWHGLVGSDSRQHPYLDEGLAQFSAVQYLADRHGPARAKEDAAMNVARNYKVMRMLGNDDGAVDRPVADFPDMMSYAGLVYGKGPFLWMALRDELGEATFFTALQGYVRDNRMRVAKPRALVEALAGADPSKAARVRQLAKRWLEEKHGDEDVGAGSFFELLGPALGVDPGMIDPKLQKLIEDLTQGGGFDPGAIDLAPLLDLLLDPDAF